MFVVLVYLSQQKLKLQKCCGVMRRAKRLHNEILAVFEVLLLLMSEVLNVNNTVIPATRHFYYFTLKNVLVCENNVDPHH